MELAGFSGVSGVERGTTWTSLVLSCAKLAPVITKTTRRKAATGYKNLDRTRILSPPGSEEEAIPSISGLLLAPAREVGNPLDTVSNYDSLPNSHAKMGQRDGFETCVALDVQQ